MEDKIKVVLIDDEEDYIQAMSMRFEASGDFSLVTARDGASGLKRVAAFQPDVVVADLQMPTMDGWEFAKRLRADPETKEIPLLIMTGYMSETLVEMAEAMGATRVLLKFFEDDGLVEAVRRAARRPRLVA